MEVGGGCGGGEKQSGHEKLQDAGSLADYSGADWLR